MRQQRQQVLGAKFQRPVYHARWQKDSAAYFQHDSFHVQVADTKRFKAEAAAAAAEVVRLQGALAVAQASAQAESTTSRIAGLEGKVRKTCGRGED